MGYDLHCKIHNATWAYLYHYDRADTWSKAGGLSCIIRLCNLILYGRILAHEDPTGPVSNHNYLESTNPY